MKLAAMHVLWDCLAIYCVSTPVKMQAAKERARQNAIDKGLLDVDRVRPTPGMLLATQVS